LKELDRQLLLALRSRADPADPLGPEWLERAAVDFTALGGHTVLTTVVLFTTVVLALQRRPAAAVWLILATGGAMLLSSGLKSVFARARPDLVEHLVVVSTSSLPSGHALKSAAIYLLLATLAGHLMASRAARRALMAMSVLLSLLIGLSRVYLGVHWPSDVLAGWLIGAPWAWGCWRLAGLKAVRRTDPSRAP
jgi:undecaprenyl-diphosphatase